MGVIKDIKNIIELSNNKTIDLNKRRLYTTSEATTILAGLGVYDYDSAKKLNDRLEEVGLIYKHRSGVWDITKKYEDKIDNIVRFESGNIKWTIEGLELIIELIKSNEISEQMSLLD